MYMCVSAIFGFTMRVLYTLLSVSIAWNNTRTDCRRNPTSQCNVSVTSHEDSLIELSLSFYRWQVSAARLLLVRFYYTFVVT